MWTAEITNKYVVNRSAFVDVKITNSKTNQIEILKLPYNSNLEDLKKLINASVKRLDEIATKLDNLPLGSFDFTIDDQTETEKNLYFELLKNWNSVQEDIKNGLIAADDPKVAKLEVDLKAAYKPEYSGL